MKTSRLIFFWVFLLAAPLFLFARSQPDSFLRPEMDALSAAMIDDYKISDDTVGYQQDYPAVAMNRYGCAVICWQDYRAGGFRLYMQLVDAKGIPVGKNLPVSPNPQFGFQEAADVAMDDRGHFVVTWMDEREGNMNIYAQRFAANGAPIGWWFKVNEDETANGQRVPAIAMNGAGDFVICWHDWTQNIFAQRYRSDGTPLGANFQVNSPATEYCDFPDVAMKQDGSFIVAWHDARNNRHEYQIYARWYDGNGAAAGEEFLVSLDLIDKSHYEPAIALQKDGRMMICYMIYSLHQTVYAHTYNPDGSSSIDYFVIPESGALSEHLAPDVAATASGGFSVVWQSDQNGTYDIWGKNYNASGLPLGNSLLLTDVPENQRNPRLALDARGAGITVWQDLRNSNWDIYGFALGPLAPLNPAAGTGFAGFVPLSWDPVYAHPNIDEYKIYRGTSAGGPYEALATVNLAQRGLLGRQMRDYIDSDVAPGTTFYYRISAMVGGVEGPQSIETSATPADSGHAIVSSFVASGTEPTIDGQIAAGEWANATAVNIANPHALLPITLYVANNDRTLFLAVDDPNDPVIEPANLLGILFDRDDNDVWDSASSSREGLFAISTATAVYIGYWGAYPNALGFDAPVPAVGVNRAITDASGHIQYEIAFDLVVSRLYLQPGATFGMAIFLDDPSNYSPFHYGYAAEWPPGALWDSARPLGKLTLVTATGIEEPSHEPPLNFALDQNYPNPFNPTTAIRYTLAEAGRVRVTIANLHGQVIRTLVDGHLSAGEQSALWDGLDDNGRAAASGLYVVRLQAGHFDRSRKMLLLR